MMYLVTNWFLVALSIIIVAHVIPGFHVASFGTALIAAIVIGLINSTLGLLLKILTFPLTIVTFGLFLFVINALMFWAAASLLSSFHVESFTAALIGSLLYSLCGMVIDVAVERLFNPHAV